MHLQRWLTLATIFLTIGYIVLTAHSIDWRLVSHLHNGNIQNLIGAIIFGVTGIGLGWVNSAADYSRYLPRHTSSRAVVLWTVFGASIVPIAGSK